MGTIVEVECFLCHGVGWLRIERGDRDIETPCHECNGYGWVSKFEEEPLDDPH